MKKVKGVNIPTIQDIKNRLKKERLSLKSFSNMKVTLEKEGGWSKTDFWGLDKYKDYLSCPDFYEGRIVGMEISIISGNPKKVGKKYYL